MVRFNDLKISPDGSCLVVSVSVDSASYYEERYITDIYIDSDSTFNNSTTPSSKAIKVSVNEDYNRAYSRTFSAAELSSLISSRNLKGHMFFVYVYLDGAVSGDAPCGTDKDMYLGVAVDWDSIYHESLEYMKQINKDCCNIPKEFIDYILRTKALELSLKTGHFMVAKNFWDKFFKEKKKTISSICGCNK